ncbi:MAG TPA: dihydropteroate synthase [Chitinophagaceae bacterium]|nr:dihydropteroate synthase [Chitinophagaceae bacterium]
MFTLNANGKLVTIDQPLVMGIINVTPDSFYAGSRFTMPSTILQQAEKMLDEGADILDIGGQSTRPGSEQISAAEELERVIPVIEAVHKKFPDAIISVDTYYSIVAKEAVAAGAALVNDVSGGSIDPGLIAVVSSLHVPYILMHIKGTPQTMLQAAQYENVTREVLDYFIGKTNELRKSGIHDIIIDPGFGFGKNSLHNFELLKNLSVLQMLDCPVLVGLSRKSTIYKTLGITADEALNGTTVLNTIALMNGANILRVHDVKEAKEAIRLVAALPNAAK